MATEPELSSGASPTPWLHPAERSFPRLTGKVEVDVAIIGGGIAGLSIAYQLAREGRSVALAEDGMLGSGETGRTTAHLASALDDRFSRLEKLHGFGGAQLAFRSHQAAIDEIGRTVRSEDIRCEYARIPGYLFAPREGPMTMLDEEFDAARRIGIRGVQMLDRAPIPGFDTGRCLRFPNQGQFHPMKYLAGLAQAVVRNGGRLFERSHVEDFDLDRQVTMKVEGGGQVRASSLVVATNAPIVSRVKIPLKQFPYRTYAVSFKIPKGAIPKALYWDTADPYH
ncbi:MAG: FAD-binding oxidoreductase, partial [Planctomycetaceae bacterium]|nr:FAD-binding oxidoreductase [Planctomycetaceae bacterium]